MRAPFAWWLATIAVAFAALAVYASQTYSVAVPAATGAVAVGALVVADAARRVRRPAPVVAPPRPLPRSFVRQQIAAGPAGREEIIFLLDRLERRTINPGLVTRSTQEVEAIVRLPPEEFRRYVAERLTPMDSTT